MKKKKQLRIISIVVIVYMLMALLWWAILLNRKNNEVFVLKEKLIKKEMILNNFHEGTISQDYMEIKNDLERQNWMVLGEGIVFGFTLILGIYFINNSFLRELRTSDKQRNFLLSITHELKSPLSSINLLFDTFLKHDLSSSKIKELSMGGKEESTRLETLFDKILTATRLEHTYFYNFEKIDLSELVKEVISRFSQNHSDVVIIDSIGSGIHTKVDREGIVSVINNLLENAYKYSPEQKHIGVLLAEKEDGVYFTISDDGIGIEVQERKKVFDQFYRVGSEDTRTSKGTGLGLYIVEKIIKAHRGKIKIEDNGERGSKFVILLPREM